MPDEAKYFIGECNVIKADSIGEPGKRTFKIEAVSDFGSITLWMEKESLYQVAISLGEFNVSYTNIRAQETEADRVGGVVV